MKAAATFFSWLGGLVTTIIAIVMVSRGVDVPVTKCNYSYYGGYSCYQVTEHQPSPAWLWVLLVVGIILRIIILIWRQNATNNGSKVGCGVCTLIFVSVIGGILTLCIPEEDLYSDDVEAKKHVSSSTEVTGLDRATKVRDLDRQLAKSEITIDEYNEAIARLDGKSNLELEAKKIEMLKKYKQLLDAEIITPEEYEQKKRDILS